MREAFILLLGLVTGILVGLMGIGGGTVVVPAMVYLLGMDQHAAQGTSLFMQLPPLGLGALWVYWKKRAVDLRAGIACALGFLPGGYAGGRLALAIPSHRLEALFGLFLILSAAMLWRQPRSKAAMSAVSNEPVNSPSGVRLGAIFAMACLVGMAGGLFGIGGGVLLVPLLVLRFGFEQHYAQGTSLIALVPPTGAFAFLAYYHAHQVDMRVALLLIPGFFLGGVFGGRLAAKLSPRLMRIVFGLYLFTLGAWQAISGLSK
jgi:uncharacterized protein